MALNPVCCSVAQKDPWHLSWHGPMAFSFLSSSPTYATLPTAIDPVVHSKVLPFLVFVGTSIKLFIVLGEQPWGQCPPPQLSLFVVKTSLNHVALAGLELTAYTSLRLSAAAYKCAPPTPGRCPLSSDPGDHRCSRRYLYYWI